MKSTITLLCELARCWHKRSHGCNKGLEPAGYGCVETTCGLYSLCRQISVWFSDIFHRNLSLLCTTSRSPPYGMASCLLLNQANSKWPDLPLATDVKRDRTAEVQYKFKPATSRSGFQSNFSPICSWKRFLNSAKVHSFPRSLVAAYFYFHNRNCWARDLFELVPKSSILIGLLRPQADFWLVSNKKQVP